MAHLDFYSYLACHETTRKRSPVGTPPPTGHPTVAPEEISVGHSSIARCIEELHRSVARGIQQTWLQGTPAQTHSWASTPPDDGTKGAVGKVPVERFDGSGVLDRFVDLATDLQTDREAPPRDLSPEPCLAAIARHGMELSETGTPGAPERRGRHCPLGTARMASDKKKPHDLAPISYSWMKVDSCSSPTYGVRGHQGVRHRTSTIGSSRTESLPLGPSACLHVGDTPDFTCSSGRAASNIQMSRSSCSICLGTCADQLSCCGIGERYTVIIRSDRSWRNTQDSIQNFSLPMHLNSTQPNTSGIEPTLHSPIASPTPNRISTFGCIRSHADCGLLRNVSGHVFTQADCLGGDETAFLYLCETQ